MYPPTQGEAAAPRPFHRLLFLVGGGLAAVIGAYLLTAPLAPGGATITTAIGIQPAVALPMMLLGFLIPAAVGAALGFFARRFPAIVAIVGIAVMAIGISVSGIAPNFLLLVAGSVVTGFGAGAVWGSVTVVALAAGGNKVVELSVLGGAVVLALAVGPFVSGAINMSLSFRIGHYMTVPPLLVALVIAIIAAAARDNRTMPQQTTVQPGP
ncbi:hypothetical protein Snas_5238 [Stackebrandtia nassauensis DSM 44728]|uniref:Major facilitator superfamily (MFS) profile domain-containing protein n=2 Tax=Stackebrandtia TaxID=283810 RepID=D3QBY3_STANL|nr:hypothetical protein Snas_5238 [Stackebrandtia nassauensis DSM 44728]